MRFSIQLRYSFDGKCQEIPQADTMFLQEQISWNDADGVLLTRSLEIGSFACAIALTAMQIREIHDWISIKSFRSDKTIFQLTVEREKSEEFERLVQTGELMQQLNEKFKDVSDQLQCSENTPNNDKVDFSALSNVSITSLTIDYGEPISIVTNGDDNNPILDHDALARVLLHENIGDKKIALFSIAGAFRKGKSFMLNFFLRYLKNRGYKCADWMGASDKPLDDGFSWKSGVARHTVGITMWSEPFIVSRNREEIAVFLLDTQGNFDFDSGKEQSTKVFALSLLLSSVFIFNIHHQVQDDDLDYLQFATEYSRVAKNRKNDIALFQNLFFLVRDWSSLDDFEYGLEGGNDYLEKWVLRSKPKSKNTTTERIRQYLKDNFAATRCYLLPDPGKKVRISRKGQSFTGCLKDIDDEFLDHVKELTDVLLKPENLVAKEGMNARSLMYFIIDCCNAITKNKNGKLPTLASMMETATESLATDLLISSTEKYDESMSKFDESCQQEFVLWVDFNKKEEGIKKKILDDFDKALSFGDDSAKKRQSKKLTRLLERAKKKFTRRNQLKQTKDRSDVTELGILLSETYEEGFLKVLDDIHSFNDKSILEKTHGKLLEDALKSFRAETAKYSEETNCEEEEKKFKKQIEDYYELMKLQHCNKLDVLEQRMQQIVCKSVKIYEDDMSKSLKVLKDQADSEKRVDFERFHVKADIEAKSHFDDRKQVAPKCMHSACLQQLEQLLNNSKQEFFDDISKEEEENDGSMLSVDAVENASEEFSALALQTQELSEVEDAGMTLHNFKKAVTEAPKRRAAFLKAMATSELLKIKIKLAENIFQVMKETKQLLWEEEELEKYIECYGENLLNEMEKGERDWCSPEGEETAGGDRHYTTELEEFICKAFSLAKNDNERNKIRIQFILEVDVLQISLDYHEEIEKELKGAYVDPEALQEMHDYWIKSQNFRKIPGLTEKANEIHKKKIVEELDARFVEFKEWNEENKTFFNRVVRATSATLSAVGSVATGGVAGGLAIAEIVTVGTAAAIGGIGTAAAVLAGAAVIGVGVLVTWGLTRKRINRYFSDTKAKLNEEIQNKKIKKQKKSEG